VAGNNPLAKTGLPPGELPAHSGDVTIQYKGLVAASVAPGTLLPNTVTVSTTTPEDGTEPNTAEAAVRTPYPDPVIFKKGPDIVPPGERFVWNITYYNATRQAGGDVYIIDTLPDADGDGVVDVTFVEQRAAGPGAVTAYYHTAGSTSAPPFNPSAPLTGGWTADPAVPVRHIAWLVGTLPGMAGPYAISVTVVAAPPAGGEPLAAGTSLRNAVEIFVSGTDENPNNNTDQHKVRTPANDVALTKTGSSEALAPGVVPGDTIAYEIVVENTGTQIAYGIEVADALPACLQAAEDGSACTLALVDAAGEPVLPVDADGNEISAPVPLTRVATADGVVWYLGSTDAGSDYYYRNIGLLPGQRQALSLTAAVASDVPGGTRIVNTATATIRNRTDAEPDEEFLANNSDTSETMAYRSDVARAQVRGGCRDGRRRLDREGQPAHLHHRVQQPWRGRGEGHGHLRDRPRGHHARRGAESGRQHGDLLPGRRRGGAGLRRASRRFPGQPRQGRHGSLRRDGREHHQGSG
jgi:uncharacterized repeat protein (TIGR01451 family)